MIRDVVTRGFALSGGIAKVVTRGYGIGAAVTERPASFVYRFDGPLGRVLRWRGPVTRRVLQP